MKKSLHIIFLVSLVWIAAPMRAFSCGFCLDHTIDWYFPFAVPLSAIAILYLIARRLFYKRLVKTLPKPSWKTLILTTCGFAAILIASMGSTVAALSFLLIVGFSSFVRAMIMAIRIRGKAPDVPKIPLFHKIFVGLWILGIIFSLSWKNSQTRLYHQLAYKTPPIQVRVDYYMAHQKTFRSNISKLFSNRVCDDPRNLRDPLLVSNLIQIIEKFDEQDFCFCASGILRGNVQNNEASVKEMYFSALNYLEKRNKTLFLNTIVNILYSQPFIGRERERLTDTQKELFAMILSRLIEIGHIDDYADLISPENTFLLKQNLDPEMFSNIKLDWSAYHIDPEKLEDPYAIDEINLESDSSDNPVNTIE